MTDPDEEMREFTRAIFNQADDEEVTPFEQMLARRPINND